VIVPWLWAFVLGPLAFHWLLVSGVQGAAIKTHGAAARQFDSGAWQGLPRRRASAM
jgi:hypothetical protein